jgi:hypothetical protein
MVGDAVPLRFAITWDYRCPFARNLHEHVVEGLLDGADWDVSFVPFSLGQVHVGEGETDVWDEPERDSGLLALQAGVVVRDHFPDRFLTTHRELFAVRHVHGNKLTDRAVLDDALRAGGVDPSPIFDMIAGGEPLETVRKEHEAAVADFDVWGVPTIMSGESASFIRVMTDARGDAELARTTVERLVDLLNSWPDLNEFKHTTRSR